MCYPIVAINRGVAQFGRAPRSGRGGRKFKSCHLDQKEAAHSLECPASFFVYLQDLNLRHEAPNAQHLAETVRGTVSQQVPYISVIDYAFLPVEQPECPASFFRLFTRFELATRGSKCVAFGRNSPGDCFAASALYFCARLRISAGGAAGMSCFLFCLFTRFELATRGSKCEAFGRNSPGDCFAASALYFCDRLSFFSSGAALFLRRCSTYCSTW